MPADLFHTALQTSPYVLAAWGVWHLPDWTGKWLAVARDVRAFRRGD